MNIFNRLAVSVSLLGAFWQERRNSLLFRWNLLFIGLQIAFILLRFNDLPQLVPLYYSQPWGESQLAPVSSLFLLPVFSIGLLLLNSVLAAFYLRSVQLFSYLLLVSSFVFSLFSFITVFNIINLVT